MIVLVMEGVYRRGALFSSSPTFLPFPIQEIPFRGPVKLTFIGGQLIAQDLETEDYSPLDATSCIVNYAAPWGLSPKTSYPLVEHL